MFTWCATGCAGLKLKYLEQDRPSWLHSFQSSSHCSIHSWQLDSSHLHTLGDLAQIPCKGSTSSPKAKTKQNIRSGQKTKPLKLGNVPALCPRVSHQHAVTISTFSSCNINVDSRCNCWGRPGHTTWWQPEVSAYWHVKHAAWWQAERAAAQFYQYRILFLLLKSELKNRPLSCVRAQNDDNKLRITTLFRHIYLKRVPLQIQISKAKHSKRSFW